MDLGLSDRLMKLVGELVLARKQILQYSNATEDTGIVALSQRLNLITTELQEGVMKTSMQPIGNIWSKFPRTVRDVATSCAKQVRIDMEGKETELDKTIIEAIKDPLTHMVRNSVDHGIETPDKRIAAGKPAEGRLLLRAYHEGGRRNDLAKMSGELKELTARFSSNANKHTPVGSPTPVCAVVRRSCEQPNLIQFFAGEVEERAGQKQEHDQAEEIVGGERAKQFRTKREKIRPPG
jgi:hypothetical protein